jgi:hypothetical protein
MCLEQRDSQLAGSGGLDFRGAGRILDIGQQVDGTPKVSLLAKNKGFGDSLLPGVVEFGCADRLDQQKHQCQYINRPHHGGVHERISSSFSRESKRHYSGNKRVLNKRLAIIHPEEGRFVVLKRMS